MHARGVGVGGRVGECVVVVVCMCACVSAYACMWCGGGGVGG